MAARGVHFALTAEEYSRVMDGPGSDEDVMAFVEEIETRWDKDWLQETDKAWDAIHRCLTNGQLEYGDDPLSMCVLAHDNIYEDDDYTVCVADADDVKQVVTAIADIDEAEMRRRYDAIYSEGYAADKSDEDFEYTWNWFVSLREFFIKAAAADRATMFTVDS